MESNLIETILTRRSCRKFFDNQIEDDDINKIVECGLSAPSGMNKQPWFIVALKNKDIINKFTENIKSNFLKSDCLWRKKWAEEKNVNFFYNPPVLFLIFGNLLSEYSKIDCAIVAENMTLACEALGLASCMIGEVSWIDKDILFEKIKVPKDYDIVLGLSVGYAKNPNKTKRKINSKKFSIID